MKNTSIALALALGGSVLAPSTSAQCDVQTLASDTSVASELFGFSVAIDAHRAIVGARFEDTVADRAGKAFVFELIGGQWTQTAGLVPSNAKLRDQFGFDVAIDGETVLVGAPSKPADHAGEAYVFEKESSGWTETAHFTAPAGVGVHSYGWSVALQGDLALIGVPGYDGGCADSGAVFVMERSGSTWSEKQVLRPENPTAPWEYGTEVAIEGNVAMVLSGQGVHVLERTPTGFVQTHLINDPWLPRFGVSFSGDHAFLPDPTDGELAPGSGADVYRRQGSGWVFDQKLKASDAAHDDHFGEALCVAGSRALIGAPNDGAAERGAVYFFELGPSGWTETAKLVSPDNWMYAFFGAAIAIDKLGTGLVGAPAHVAVDTEPRAYAYVLDGPDCNGNGVPDFCDLANGTSSDVDGDGFPDECGCVVQGYCTATPNSTGATSSLLSLGSLSISRNDWTLVAVRCPPSQFGIFYYGAGQTQVPFGDGWRCVAAPSFRLPVVPINAAGEAVFPIDFENPPQPAGQITAGSIWNFQFWYRDPGAGGAGFNLSMGMSAGFCP